MLAGLVDPLTITEVAAALKRTKNSTPVPDGYRLSDIRAIAVSHVTVMLNLNLLLGPDELPPGVYDSIKKTDRYSSLIGYRPIAVGNFIVRVLHRALAWRVEGYLINHTDQVRYQRYDGVTYNILKLPKIFGEAWRHHEKGVTLIVNLQKAFGSVSKYYIPRWANYIRSSMDLSHMLVRGTPVKPGHLGWCNG